MTKGDHDGTFERNAWTVKSALQSYSISTQESAEYIVKPFNMDPACSTTIVNIAEGISSFDPTDVQQFKCIVQWHGLDHSEGKDPQSPCGDVVRRKSAIYSATVQ